jgi:AraC-like DNA-binding protein
MTPPLAQRFVYARAVRGFLDLAAALGADREHIAAAAGIEMSQLSGMDANIPVVNYYRLQRELLAQTGNSDFGILSGRVSYMESAHLLLYLASVSQTLREWMNMLPAIDAILGDVGSIKVRRDRDHYILDWCPLEAPDSMRCAISDAVLSTTALQMDGYCLLPVQPVRVDFTYPQPDDVTVLRETFRAPLYFNQISSALHYDRSTLDYPQVHVATRIYDAVASEFSSEYSDEASALDPFFLNLHAAIRRQLPRGECSIDMVASDMNVSRRTLQRRLSERNTHFQQALQQVKGPLARKYLDDKSLTVIEISFLLGYADPSSFSAAFKAWSGNSPTEYRQR